MRPVKARRVRTDEPARGARRGKAAARGWEARGETRRRKREPAGDEGGVPGSARAFALRRPMLVLTLVLIVMGGAAGLFAGGHVAKAIDGMQAAIASPFTKAGFAVGNIVLSGQERTTTQAAVAALGIAKGASIFAARPDAARARLLMLPWVSDAEVRRRFPDTVSVRLIEKRPFALWKNGNELLVIERSGAVITSADARGFGHLPLITGAGAPEAAAPVIDALAGEKAIEARLQAIERIGERRWDLLLAGGVTVRLPEEGWERQLPELERLIVEKGVLERDIEMIDLRYPDNYVFRLHNGDSRPIPRERHA